MYHLVTETQTVEAYDKYLILFKDGSMQGRKEIKTSRDTISLTTQLFMLVNSDLYIRNLTRR